MLIWRTKNEALEFWRCTAPRRLAVSRTPNGDFLAAALHHAGMRGVTAPRPLRRAVKAQRIKSPDLD